jgi:uncharacterized membrane protein YhaH (DUF805 family)
MNYYTDVLKKYAVFAGRARRKEYWMWALLNFFVAVGALVVSVLLLVATKSQWSFAIAYLYALATIIPGISVTVRRLHDTNHSGWWWLIQAIPLVGFIVILVFTVTDSQPGDNQYGPNPKGQPGMRAETVAPVTN